MKYLALCVAALALGGCILLGNDRVGVDYTLGVESAEPFHGEHTFKVEATISGK